MTRGRRRLLLLALALLVGVTPATTAHAADQLGVAWWWKGYATSAFPRVLPPPTEVPEGGLYVAADPSGPSGVSALRFDLADDAADPRLTLEIAENTGVGMVWACPAADPWSWSETDGGAWDERPAEECAAAQVEGERSDDGARVTFDLAPLEKARLLDIVLVPGDGEGPEQAETFEIAFEPPDAEALTTRAATTPAPPEPAEPEPSAPAAQTADPPASPPAPIPESTTPEATPEVAGPRASSLAPPPQREEAVGEPEPATEEKLAAEARAAPIPGTADEHFPYRGVLVLPLMLLVAGGYLAWTLTQPVSATARARR